MTTPKESTPPSVPVCELQTPVLDQLLRMTDQLLRMTEHANRDHKEALTLVLKMEEAIRAIARTLDTHYSETLTALIGKNQNFLPLSITMKLLQLTGLMVIFLFLALIFTLTGQHFDLLPIISKVVAP